MGKGGWGRKRVTQENLKSWIIKYGIQFAFQVFWTSQRGGGGGWGAVAPPDLPPRSALGYLLPYP